MSWRTDERQRSSTATGKEVKRGSESTGVRGGGVGRKRVQKSPFFVSLKLREDVWEL